jgi:hypothetical protein
MDTPFTDIDHYDEASKAAIGWAYEAGITRGISADKFGPDLPVTRTQMLLFLHRFAYYLETPPPQIYNPAGIDLDIGHD